jgi:hypothetical protein
LLVRNFFGRLHAIQSNEPEISNVSTRYWKQKKSDAPADHLAPSLPVLAPLKPSISCDKLLQDGVKLILCAKPKL